jgi:DNA invertase Pin-like site-specific DNA recombinase
MLLRVAPPVPGSLTQNYYNGPTSTTSRKQRAPTGTTAIYARISSDRHDGDEGREGAGVQRQEQLCRELAQRNRWKIAEAFIDNNRSASAYAKRPRPRYIDLLAAIREGHITRVLCYKVDRLYRQPRELQDMLDLAREGRPVEVVQVHGGTLDLTSGPGQAMAEFGVSMAKLETRNTSDRIRDEQKQRRAKGLPNGAPRAFGWMKDGVTPNPDEAAVLNKAFDDVLAGRSLGDIAREWNDKQVKKGRTWGSVDVGRVLRLPRHAGLLGHNGEVLQGSWKGLLPVVKWEQVVAVLNSRSKVLGIPRRRSMLTNLIFCGECGEPMRRSSVHGVKIWICVPRPNGKGCGKVSVRVDLVEPLVVRAVIKRVDTTSLASLAGKQGAPDIKKLQAALDMLDRREDESSDMYAAGKSTARSHERIIASIMTERQVVSKRLADLSRLNALAAYAGKRGVLAAAWDDLSVDQRRDIIAETFGTITVDAARVRGAKFDPSRIHLGDRKPR